MFGDLPDQPLPLWLFEDARDEEEIARAEIDREDAWDARRFEDDINSGRIDISAYRHVSKS